MDSPFDANPPQHPNGAPRPEPASTHARDESRELTPAGRVPLTRIDPVPAAAGPQAAGGVAYSRTLTESTVVWRDQPAAGRSVSRNDWLLGIAASACISACVSLLAMWLWSGQGQAASPELVDAMTVTYEPLESTVSPQPDTEPPASAPAAPDEPVVAPADARRGRPDTSTGPVAPAPVTRRAGFVVLTEPEGAHVTINGVGYGTSPVNIPYLPPGSRRIRATKSGYESAERFLGAEAARAAANLKIVLREATASSRDPE